MMKHFVKEFDALTPGISARRVRISRASKTELVSIYPRFAASLSQQIASLSICEYIRIRNEDNFWSIWDRRDDALIGMYAMAMLTTEGHVALTRGEFDATDPRLSHVAETGEAVSAVYKWGVYAPGIAAAAIPLISQRLNSKQFKEIDLYGTGSTSAGRRIMINVGFLASADPRTPHLYKYERLAKRGQYEITR